MTRAEINTAFTSKVAEYLAKGYTFNTNTMNGSQGEIAKVDLTDGTEIVRVLLDSFSDYDTGTEGLEILVGRVTDTKIRPHEVGSISSTIWNNRLEVLETERFYKLGSDRHNGIFYGTKAEAEKAAAIKRERYIANITGGVTENITDKAREIAKRVIRRQLGIKRIYENDIKVYRNKVDGTHAVEYRGKKYILK